MTKNETIKHRELCEKATYTAKNEDGTEEVRKVPIHVVCDNSLNIIDKHDGNVIWDDENERIVYFTYNSESTFYNSPSNAMSFGNQPMVPAVAIVVDYGEIQNLRILLNREAMENLFIALGSSITNDQKDNMRKKFFTDLTMDNIIKRKRQYSYVTQTKKDSKEASINYTDSDEYRRTVNPVSW